MFKNCRSLAETFQLREKVAHREMQKSHRDRLAALNQKWCFGVHGFLFSPQPLCCEDPATLNESWAMSSCGELWSLMSSLMLLCSEDSRFLNSGGLALEFRPLTRVPLVKSEGLYGCWCVNLSLRHFFLVYLSGFFRKVSIASPSVNSGGDVTAWYRTVRIIHTALAILHIMTAIMGGKLNCSWHFSSLNLLLKKSIGKPSMLRFPAYRLTQRCFVAEEGSAQVQLYESTLMSEVRFMNDSSDVGSLMEEIANRSDRSGRK